ncbi:MAG: hypothetical protein VX681_07210 [Myxococcota bacterium]|nr:hypothetical protein [Myxococcota bacterium]
MSKIELEDRGRSLEDEFFRKEQAKQLEALRSGKQRKEAIEALREASGLTDEDVLGSLVDLGVSAATLVAFALLPLALVAWADGELADEERNAILQAARETGIAEGSPAHDFLSNLLAAKPAAALMDAWEAFVTTLREQAGPEAFAAIGGNVVERARSVAEAAGGILGIGSISQPERDALARVEAALS